MSQDETRAPEQIEADLETQQNLEILEKEIQAEVQLIADSLGLQVNHAVNSTLKHIDQEFYTEELNDINEHRKNISTITNRILITIVNDYNAELEENKIQQKDLKTESYNRGMIKYANMYFSTNLAELFKSVEGDAKMEEAFKQAMTIISYLVGCAIPKEYIHFDLCTVQVLHSIQRNLHDSYKKIATEDGYLTEPTELTETPVEPVEPALREVESE